ncbi:hypothetical protein HY570_00665 [Candidatus Micrarchaeota archaeon]|nr:hypothetical protein [Candidatus Micrarchaeota archaeon]
MLKIKSGLTIMLNTNGYLLISIVTVLITALISLFMMTIISLPALILHNEIIVAPYISAIDLAYFILFTLITGLSLSMHIFSFRNNLLLHSSSSTTVTSIFLSMFTTACPVCAPLILTILNVPASFAILPLQGAEFKFISLILVIISLYLVSENISNKCEIKK